MSEAIYLQLTVHYSSLQSFAERLRRALKSR